MVLCLGDPMVADRVMGPGFAERERVYALIRNTWLKRYVRYTKLLLGHEKVLEWLAAEAAHVLLLWHVGSLISIPMSKAWMENVRMSPIPASIRTLLPFKSI